MAQKTPANPIANLYEAQTLATVEIAQAALDGMQRLQKLTLQALRVGAEGQLSLVQSAVSLRDGSDVKRAVSEIAAPAAEQGARYQRELLQAIADMNNDIVRASYSMVERMRDALATAAPGSLAMTSALPSPAMGGEAFSNPLALYDSAMRQWQTAVQQMMETPAVALAVASANEGERPRAAGAAAASKSKRSAARKSSERSR